MKLDYVNAAVIFGVSIILIDIFFNEYMFGLDVPLILVALLIIIIAYWKHSKDERKKNR